MASGGTYRINSKEFPAPVTTWSPQIIGAKLNGLPSLNSYYLHTWSFPEGMDPCDMEDLLTLFYQQHASGQLDELETDPYDASGANEKYGTVVYTDFLLKTIEPQTREYPGYSPVAITFEIFISAV